MTEYFQVGKAPQIIIEACHGDLVVKGWDEHTVRVKAEDAQVNGRSFDAHPGRGDRCGERYL